MGTGPLWAWRAMVLLYVGYAGFRHLADPDYWSIFSGITFGLHELGHLVFAFFGSFLSVAGGTIAQLALPIVAAALLWSHRDFFGVAVTGGWLPMSLAEMAVYVADAREQSLILLGFGRTPSTIGTTSCRRWDYWTGIARWQTSPACSRSLF